MKMKLAPMMKKLESQALKKEYYIFQRQYHKKKEETFVILHGAVDLYLNDEVNTLNKGDVITIEPEVRHRFETSGGCVIEEVSSTHYKDDSYYVDPAIAQNQNRKTFIPHWRA